MSGWQSKKAVTGDKLSDEMVKLVAQECIGLISKDLQEICLTTFDLQLKDAILERQTRSISEYFSITYKGVAPKQHS